MGRVLGPQPPTFSDLVQIREQTCIVALDPATTDAAWERQVAGDDSAFRVAQQQGAADPAYAADLAVDVELARQAEKEESAGWPAPSAEFEALPEWPGPDLEAG